MRLFGMFSNQSQLIINYRRFRGPNSGDFFNERYKLRRLYDILWHRFCNFKNPELSEI